MPRAVRIVLIGLVAGNACATSETRAPASEEPQQSTLARAYARVDDELPLEFAADITTQATVASAQAQLPAATQTVHIERALTPDGVGTLRLRNDNIPGGNVARRTLDLPAEVEIRDGEADPRGVPSAPSFAVRPAGTSVTSTTPVLGSSWDSRERVRSSSADRVRSLARIFASRSEVARAVASLERQGAVVLERQQARQTMSLAIDSVQFIVTLDPSAGTIEREEMRINGKSRVVVTREYAHTEGGHLVEAHRRTEFYADPEGRSRSVLERFVRNVVITKEK